MSARRSSSGFTLLELIVAAAILALIAVFSWRGLDALLREREAIAASQAAIDVWQRSFARLERDALLAGDVELDDDGTLRLVAGGGADAGSDDAAPPAVEYRVRDGALVRTVPGVDRTPLVLVERVASVAIEAWTPAPRGGGAWVRAKVAAQPVAVPQPAPPGTALSIATSTAVAKAPTVPDAQKPAPGPVAATGVRFTIATVDGARLVRTFIVGGA